MRLFFDFVIGEYRAVLADQVFSHHAVTAFAQSTGHVLFHGQVNVLFRVTHFQEFHGPELHHDGRAAHHSHGIFYIHVHIVKQYGYHTYPLAPVPVCLVHAS